MDITKLIAVFYVSLLAGAGAEEEGFVPLFNGKDLSGREVLGGATDYKVDGGRFLARRQRGAATRSSTPSSTTSISTCGSRRNSRATNSTPAAQVRSSTSADPRAKSKEMERFAAQLRAAGEKGRTEWQLKELPSQGTQSNTETAKRMAREAPGNQSWKSNFLAVARTCSVHLHSRLKRHAGFSTVRS